MNQLAFEQDAVIRFVLFRTMTALFGRRRHTHVASALSVWLTSHFLDLLSQAHDLRA